MNDRYESHENLYLAYLNGLSEDRKIYELIKNEDVNIEELSAQVEISNQAYESVFEANRQFNEQTEKLNNAKIKFYEASGIKIETAS